MLNHAAALATVAVKDLAVARKFYEGSLGLVPSGAEGEELVSYKTGSSSLLVYKSAYAGTNRATAATWIVGPDVEGVARALKDKGVTFEHYDDMPGLTRQGDVYVGGTVKVAWFKDPDGNIHSIVSG